MFNKKYIIIIFMVVATTSAGWLSSLISKGGKDPYYEAMKNIKIFGTIYREINDRYIEEIAPDKFIRAGIEGMLERLDPYTVYLEQEGKDELQIMTRGKYYGVGMRIVTRNGWPTVAEHPFPDSPAFRAGIREGDQIIEIDGKSTKGESLSATAARLRGSQKGTEVTVKIRRIGEDDPLIFTLIRDEITVSDIQYSGFVEPGIGLIKFNRFNRGAEDQIADSLRSLINGGLKGLILDLRSNPGGLLDVAVAVSDIFVDKNELIVFTKGRNEQKQQEFRAQREPLLGNLPLIVLVDEYSASASEIVAGAIQDLDRGVIIGSQTFGKGLVQTVVPLDRRGETQLKLTTAQYFMPSGRLIQKPDIFERGRGSVFVNNNGDDEEKDDDNPHSEDEKLKEQVKVEEQKYYTKNKRLVLGGGGIKPDVEVQNFKLNRYEIELLRRSLFFNFSLDYVSNHPDISHDFKVTDDVIKEFIAFIESKEFDYKPEGYEKIDELEGIAKEEGYTEKILTSIENLRATFTEIKRKQMIDSEDHLKIYIKSEILAKIYGKDASIEATFQSDSTLMKGVEILKNMDDYNRILNVNLAMQK